MIIYALLTNDFEIHLMHPLSNSAYNYFTSFYNHNISKNVVNFVHVISLFVSSLCNRCLEMLIAVFVSC